MPSFLELVKTLVPDSLKVKGAAALGEALAPFFVSEVPLDQKEVESSKALAPLPVDLKMFRFEELNGRFGEIEGAFTADSDLVNLRVQLFFPGSEGGHEAREFWEHEFKPFIQSYYSAMSPADHPVLSAALRIRFPNEQAIGVARLLPGLGSVSFWLTDERYE